eukprot:COSAG02_NODE_5782_length_4038_cov_2.503427_5_plen_134_part_01
MHPCFLPSHSSGAWAKRRTVTVNDRRGVRERELWRRIEAGVAESRYEGQCEEPVEAREGQCTDRRILGKSRNKTRRDPKRGPTYLTVYYRPLHAMRSTAHTHNHAVFPQPRYKEREPPLRTGRCRIHTMLVLYQ